jgi:hypothetical protein
MNQLEISKALSKLDPTAEFSFSDTDLESLIWVSTNPKPTKQQIEVMHKTIIDQQNAEAEAKATARASALAKLAALGLSADEIAAL